METAACLQADIYIFNKSYYLKKKKGYFQYILVNITFWTHSFFIHSLIKQEAPSMDYTLLFIPHWEKHLGN